MANATKIDVHLLNPNGTPMTNTRFTVKPVRSGFWSTIAGLVEDVEIIYVTDDKGYVQMSLQPLPYPYVMTYSYDDDSVPGHYLFYVPQLDSVLSFQDLIVTKADSNDNYGDTILAQIVAAKAEVSVLAGEAEQSATTASEAASTAVEAKTSAQANATQTGEDRAQVAITANDLQATLLQFQEAIIKIQAINLTNKLKLGDYTLWVDANGKLRIVQGEPSGDLVGVVVGTQTD